ncbi:FadR/GntR family transcriptional regulator, partial [Streptomyces xiamenensis]|uniref:FadR/GntR family transcriptional regulator n=1 Tax=Streptomyces xiamenensis TaxID=408015 RepID=UPI0036B969D9
PTAMDSLFHLGVARAARNPVLRKVIGEIRDAQARQSGLLRQPAGRRAASDREHRAIVRALIDGSHDDAVAAMAHHLDRVEASLASLVRPGPPEGERRP